MYVDVVPHSIGNIGNTHSKHQSIATERQREKIPVRRQKMKE